MTDRPRAIGAGPTLVVDAATYRGTVAVVEADRVIATEAVAMRGEREERVGPGGAGEARLADCRSRDDRRRRGGDVAFVHPRIYHLASHLRDRMPV